mgnify:FL=1
MHVELLQDMINVLSYQISKRDYTVEELLQILKDEFANDSYYPTGSDPVNEYSAEVESAFGSANDGEMYNEYLQYLEKGNMKITEAKLLKERWHRLAFAKGNQSLNESERFDRFHGVLPQELWEISDYEDYRDSGIDLRQYKPEQLRMKIEQLREEIKEEMNYLDDPQNQYDSAIAPKESLINVIEDIVGPGVHQR